jgi:anti-sigma B factor antagonist
MTNFSVNQHTVNDGVLRLAVAGELDLSTCEQLGDAINDAITVHHAAELVIDLDQVTFLDSTGINALVGGHHLAAEHGVAYLVTQPHGLVEQTLDITAVLADLTE